MSCTWSSLFFHPKYRFPFLDDSAHCPLKAPPVNTSSHGVKYCLSPSMLYTSQHTVASAQ